MPVKRRLFNAILFVFMLCALSGCRAKNSSDSGREFVILSGSENQTLEPLLQEFGQANKVKIVMKYQGSVDIMQALGAAEAPYDAVWPANSLWIALGDTPRRVKYAQSIMTSPVVFGIRQSLAQQLGFVGRDVKVRELLDAIRAKQFTFMMTSATQSNSGATAYLGFLYALLGNPDVLTVEMLQSPQLRDDITSLLGGVHRSSGSSGWLKDLFLQGNYDAMVNYEAILIETNQALIQQNREPLYVIYPVDGVVFSDSPLGYLDHGDAQKEEMFKQLQTFLLSDAAQQRILRMGRRTGIGGVMGAGDPTIFNAAWGINVEKILTPITIPTANVIEAALNLYQAEFRKPSLTVYCLDFSGSMKGEGSRQLKQAMTLLLDQQQAKMSMLQAAPNDVTVVIPFHSEPAAIWRADGNNPQALRALLQQILDLNPDGGTDIYRPAQEALKMMLELPLENYVPAIILLTDGNSEGSSSNFEQAWRASGRDIPVFSIMFGEASPEQLNHMANVTRGRVFDGRQDLVNAFRAAKGYN